MEKKGAGCWALGARCWVIVTEPRTIWNNLPALEASAGKSGTIWS